MKEEKKIFGSLSLSPDSRRKRSISMTFKLWKGLAALAFLSGRRKHESGKRDETRAGKCQRRLELTGSFFGFAYRISLFGAVRPSIDWRRRTRTKTAHGLCFLLWLLLFERVSRSLTRCSPTRFVPSSTCFATSVGRSVDRATNERNTKRASFASLQLANPGRSVGI